MASISLVADEQTQSPLCLLQVELLRTNWYIFKDSHFLQTNIENQMKTKFYTFLILMTCLSCCSVPSHHNERQEFSKMDSLGRSMQKAFLEGDSITLRTVLANAANVLLVDTINNNRYKLYMLRSSIYRFFGEIDSAFYEEGHAVELLPMKHVDRYIYYGEKAKYYGNVAEAQLYFRQALKLCNEQLSQNFDRNGVVKAVKVFMLLEMKDSAQSYVDKYISLHPEDNDLKLIIQEL